VHQGIDRTSPIPEQYGSLGGRRRPTVDGRIRGGLESSSQLHPSDRSCRSHSFAPHEGIRMNEKFTEHRTGIDSMQPASGKAQCHTHGRARDEKFPHDSGEASFFGPSESRGHTTEAFRLHLDHRDAALEHRALLTLQRDDRGSEQGAGTALAGGVGQSRQAVTTGDQASVQMPGDSAVEPIEMTKGHMAGARVFPSRVPQRRQVLDML
jgi:hypothetical protein